MKNIKIFSLMLIGLSTLFGCDPLQDDIDDIMEAEGAGEAVTVAKDIEYTLTEDDYDTMDEICDCTGFGNFSSEDDVSDYLPLLLDELFPALGNQSSAVITYDFYNGSSPDLRGTQSTATVTDAEYDELGFTFGNFSNLNSDIPTYANYKFTDGSDGDYADITHDYWDGSFQPDVVSRAVYSVAYGWLYANEIPDDDYGDFFGESGIDFSYEDEGEEKLPVYLKETQLFAEAGDIQLWQWNWDADDDGTLQSVVLFIFDGTNWNTYGDVAQISQESISLGHNGTAWVPDNTIKYTLSNADYQEMGAAFAEINASGSASMLQYGNYDLTLWSSDEIFDSITAQLVELFEEVEGQKYLVTYATWEPGAGTGEIHVIWNGTEYVLVEE